MGISDGHWPRQKSSATSAPVLPVCSLWRCERQHALSHWELSVGMAAGVTFNKKSRKWQAVINHSGRVGALPCQCARLSSRKQGCCTALAHHKPERHQQGQAR